MTSTYKRQRSQMTMCYDYPSIVKRPRTTITPSSSASVPIISPNHPPPSSSSTIVLSEHDDDDDPIHFHYSTTTTTTTNTNTNINHSTTNHTNIINPNTNPPDLLTAFYPYSQQPCIQFYPPMNDQFGEKKLKNDLYNSFCNSSSTSNEKKYATKYEWTDKSLVNILTKEIEDMYNYDYLIEDHEYEFNEYHSFYSQSKQPFDLHFYINRLITYSNCSSAAYIIMLAYIDQIQQIANPFLLINDMNCHRIILTCLVLAIKFIDDEVFSNSHYACVGGVEPNEMNELEMKLLKILNWQLYVSPEMFKFYENTLIKKHQIYKQQQQQQQQQCSNNNNLTISNNSQQPQSNSHTHTHQHQHSNYSSSYSSPYSISPTI